MDEDDKGEKPPELRVAIPPVTGSKTTQSTAKKPFTPPAIPAPIKSPHAPAGSKPMSFPALPIPPVKMATGTDLKPAKDSPIGKPKESSTSSLDDIIVKGIAKPAIVPEPEVPDPDADADTTAKVETLTNEDRVERDRLDSLGLKAMDKVLAAQPGGPRMRGLSIFDEIDAAQPAKAEPDPEPANDPDGSPLAPGFTRTKQGFAVTAEQTPPPRPAITQVPDPPVMPVIPDERPSQPEIIEINAPFLVTEETPIPKLEDIPKERRKLGGYEVIKTLGSGGMAEVYLARKDGLMGFEKHVALKCIHPHLTKEDHFVTMFLDEARLAAKINDPRVAQIYELGEADGMYFIAMEYLAGENLNTIIRKGLKGGPPLPPHLAARIVVDVAGGLHAAHELRDEFGLLLDVVHRDMSHGNIIVLYSGAVKVLDFGVAKARNSLTKTIAGERKGKYGYMSPEQIRGEELDRRSDVFSLGVVLWEVLTRKRLFAADSEPATMKRVLEGDPPPPSTLVPAVSAELDQIVAKALAKDRRDRYQSAEDMAKALEVYLHHAGVAASSNDVAGYMRTAFADRIEAKVPSRITREGEPLPMADLKTTDKVLTPTQVVGSSSSKAGWIVAGIAIVALIGGGAFVLGRDRGSNATAPPIAAVKPDGGVASGSAAPPDKSLIDSKLEAADIAIRNGRIASPPGDNALEMIIDVEALDPANTRAKSLRTQAIAKLLADADALWVANKQDSARSIYEDVLLFDPTNKIAAARRKSTEPRIVPKTKAEVAIANPDEIPWLVSQIDLAIIERRLIEPPGRNALEYLQRLRKLDPKGTAGKRLGSEVEKALASEAGGTKGDDKDKLLAAAREAHGGAEAGAGSGSSSPPAEKARDPKAAQDWITKGNAQLGSGNLTEARRAFEKAIVADSGAHGALAGLAEVAYNESDYTRAVLSAKRAVQLAPTATPYRMSLAKSYYKLLRYDDAIAQWKKVIELAPKSPMAGSAQKNIEMAERKMGGN